MKKGISLIVLVITIIVMIILAAAVVISMSSIGVIDKAAEAVNLTDEAQVQDLAALIWADAYMNDKRDEELISEVEEKLGEHGITSENYEINITTTGVSVKKIKEITFTIEGVTYKAKEGMNWKDWIMSSYNTAGYKVSAQLMCPMTSDSKIVLSPSGTRFNLGKIIEAGEIYTHNK